MALPLMRYIGLRLNSVEAAMLKEVEKKRKEFRNIEILIKLMILEEYQNLGLK